MINVSSEFKRLLYSGEGNFIVDATITLSDNTVLNVSNSRIMSNGLEIDDAVGDDNDFNCIGSTIVNGCELILYNNDEIYSNYDFINAKVSIVVKLMTSNGYESVQKGTYTVDAATFSDVSVTLTLLDNMCQFDRPYDSYSIYNANTTIYDVVLDACTECGVTPASSMTNMPNKTFVVAGKPKDDTTYREVIGWCAAIAGCFARCNPDGELEFAWFDVGKFDLDEGTDGGIFDNSTPYYSTGDAINGGAFNPWNDPANADGGLLADRSGIHHISALKSQNIGVDDVVITAVQIAYDVETNSKAETKYYPTTIADDNYVISINSIPFIDDDNVQTFYTTLATKLIGLTFRTCNVTQTHDPTIEAGDIAWLWDTKGEKHRILITRTVFAVAGVQTIVCGAKTPARNSATQMTALAKANARSNRRLNEEMSLRAQLETNFNNYVANSTGLYLDEVTDGSGAVTIYGHDKPRLVQSTKVLKISNGAISMADNYTGDDATTTWYGFQFNGTWLANIVSSVELFFEHAHGGTLTLGGAGNGKGELEILDANNATIGKWDNQGIEISAGTIQGPRIILGGNNNVNGTLYVRNSNNTNIISMGQTGLTVSQGTIEGPTIIAGGTANGKIIVKDSSGTEIGRWTNSGIEVKAGTIQGPSIILGGNGNTNGTLYVRDSNNTNVVSMGQTGLTVKAGTIQGPKIIVGGSGNDDGTITVKNSSGTTIGTWDNTGLKVSVGEISGNLIKAGTISDANSNVVLNLSSGTFTMKQGSINLGDGAFTVNTNGVLTSTRVYGGHTLKVVISEADIKGYQGSTLFGHLDLCAQYNDGRAHASLEGVTYLHLEAGSKISFETGAIYGQGTERAYIDSTGLHADDVYADTLHAGNGANNSRVCIPTSIDGSGLVNSYFYAEIVDGILCVY